MQDVLHASVSAEPKVILGDAKGAEPGGRHSGVITGRAAGQPRQGYSIRGR